MSRVLLAGESWVARTADVKGFDAIERAQIEIGAGALIEALRAEGHEVTHLLSHDVAAEFPSTLEELGSYDVVLLSDIGANSLLLHPDVFAKGKRFPNRLKLLAEWVRAGGGLAMAGGYLSFQGFGAKANYHATPVEEILPVDILPYDDRVECPEGIEGELTDQQHEITEGLDRHWPALLGYQRLTAKRDATVLAEIESCPLLAVRTVGQGRTLAFASDISPHWAPEEFLAWKGYRQLFGRAIGWLAGGRG
ncbi:glutamine amidotransferase [Sciscionella marina]|uniref:glutamine amidotransferase n=1 Tax=Sciscionella marina TaxID=508770 RepID=UPI000371FE36|nr:glutamine amidotransferase [Sciscionella marina]